MQTMKRLLLSTMMLGWLGWLGCEGSTVQVSPEPEDPITGTIADGGGNSGTDKPSDAGASSDAGSDSDAGAPADGGTSSDAGGDLDAGSPADAGGSSDAGDALDAGSPADAGPPGPRFTTPQEIGAYLERKTLLMTGENIPSHPHGYDEDINYGSATQCYQSVTKQVSDGTHHETLVLGTLRNASTAGSRGECDHDTASSTLNFSTTSLLIENVQADGSCFDVQFVYPGFRTEGRGSLSQDGLTLRLELFFGDQATGIHCADGAVGAPTVTLNRLPFTGNAVQVYTLVP